MVTEGDRVGLRVTVRGVHKYRHGHAMYALQGTKNMAVYKAASQNLMHADISVTDGIYARLLGSEVQQRIASLDNKMPTTTSTTPEPQLDYLLKQPGAQPFGLAFTNRACHKEVLKSFTGAHGVMGRIYCEGT
jgi:hypothetical protein